MSKFTKNWHIKAKKSLANFKNNLIKFSLKIKKPYIITPLVLGIITLTTFVGYRFIQAAAIPDVSISGTTTPLIGGNFSTSIDFNNAGGDAGFGPFIDVIVPRNGADGVFPYGPGDEADGVTFNSATINGLSATPVLSTTFPDAGAGTGCVNHPLAVDSSNVPRVICGTAGDSYLVFQLPYGSYVSDQPTSTLSLSLSMSNLADISTPLNIIATGGFRFGIDSLNNPSTDPSIYTPYDVNLPQPPEWATHSVTPSLVTISNSDNPSENEVPSGPNSPQTYTSQIQVASGQTIGESGNPSENVVFTNTLSDKVTYLGSPSLPAGCSVTTAPSLPTDTIFEVTCDSLGAGSHSISFQYFVDYEDNSSNQVISPLTGNDVTFTNDISLSAAWVPVDTRDTTETFNLDTSATDDSTTTKSIVIQKAGTISNNVGSAGLSPGDTIQYTLNFALSDFFGFDDIVVTDILSDGLRIDETFTPTLNITEHNVNQNITFGSSNFTIQDKFTGGSPEVVPLDGTQIYTFNVSNQLIDSLYSPNGVLLGGCIPQSGTGGNIDCDDFDEGATRGTITFRAIVQENYTNVVGDQSLDLGDTVSNNVTVEGNIVNTSDASTPTGFNEDDTSGWSGSIDFAGLTKEVYAINGNTSFSQYEISPGDDVTYKLSLPLSSSDFESLILEDYFPLPVFDVENPNSDGTSSGLSEWSFDTNASATAPAPGVIQLSDDDTFFTLSQGVLGPLGLQPTLSIVPNSNKLVMSYGDFDDPNSVDSVIDLLVTVTVSNEQFADGLFITNQVASSINNTFGSSSSNSSASQIELKMPDVKISKGAVKSDNTSATFVDDDLNSVTNPVPTGVVFSAPGGSCSRFSSGDDITSSKLATTPITANFDNVDANDKLSFAVIAENIGGSPQGAFDVTLKDILPSEYAYQTGSLCVTDGNGNVLNWTAVDGANTNPFFEDGIRLNNPLSVYDENSGTNLAVIVYDVMLNSSVQPEQTFENTAELTRFSGAASGPNYVNVSTTDNSRATINTPQISKIISGTNLATTSGNTAAEGEILTYQVSLTVPEGTMQNTILEDALDTGLIFQECSSIATFSGGSPTSDITTNGSTDFSSICNDPTNPTVSGNARTINFNLDSIVNNNTDNTQSETIVVTYNVVVSNENTTKGSDKNNSASLKWGPTPGSPINTITASAPNVRIYYPDFVLTKAFSPTTADAGDTIGVTLTLRQDNGANETTGYDIQAQDILPTGLTFAGSLVCSNNTGNQTSCSESGGTITATYSSMNPSPTVTETITFNVTVDTNVSLGQVIANTLTVNYSSLPGNPGQQSTYGVLSESEEDLYSQNTSANLSIFTPSPTKSITATSESHTGSSGGVAQLAIGEIVRYRLVTRIAETTSTNIQFVDLIPNGVQFLNDGTAKVALVSNNVGISSSTLIPASINCDGGANPNLTLSGNASNLSSLTPECPLPDDAVSSSASSNTDNYGYTGGDDVYFKFGDLTNSDNDSDAEYIVVEFNGLLLNVSGNTEGLNINNQFRINVNGSTVATSTTGTASRIQVLRSEISTDKVLTVTPQEAGDTVTYRVTMTSPSGTTKSTSFDNTFTDTLSGKVTNITTNIISSPVYSTLTDNSSGNNVNFTVSELRPGDSIIIDVSGTMSDTTEAEQLITNSAQTMATSLPGSGTTGNSTGSNTPGIDPSNRDRERSLTTSDTASFSTIAPTIDLKTLADTTYRIGDTITYNILVNLNQGVTKGVKIPINIPAGLEYQSHTLLTTALSSTLLTDDFSGSVSNPTFASSEFTFGDITVPANGSETDESFVLQVTVLLTNILGNQRGDSLSTTAQLQFTEPDIPSTVTVTDANGGAGMTIVEPILEMSKSITSSQPSYDGGDIVEYKIELNHHTNSNVDAFDVNITDLLPTEFDSINVTDVTATGFSAPSTSTTSDPNLIVGNSPSNTFDFPLGATLEITYEATLDDNIAPIKNIVNDAKTTWNSQDGGGANSRSGDSGNNYDLTESRTTNLNDYQAEASETFISSGPTYQLNLIGSSNYTIGDTVTYELIATLPEGIIQNVSLEDFLPAGLIYQNATVDTTGFNGTVTTTPTITGGSTSGEDVTIEFGNVIVNSDGNGSNNTFKVVLTTKVVNELGNQRADILSNSSEMSFTNPNTLLAETVTASNTPEITLIEPILELTKLATNFPTVVNKDSQITYTITVAHNPSSNANAYDVSLTDFTTDQFDSIESVTITPTGITAPSYQIINDKDLLIPNSTDSTFDLPLGASLSIELVVNVDEFINPEDTLENSSNITWSSLNGNVSGERTAGDGSYDLAETSATNLNDYELSTAETSVTVDDKRINKFFVSSNNSFTPETPNINVAIGEQVTFFIRVYLEEGTTNSYIIRDEIPDNLIIDNVELITNAVDSFNYMAQNFGASSVTPTISTTAGDGNDIEVTLSNVINPTDGNGPNNFLGLKVLATVRDIPANTDTTSFQSSANGQRNSDAVQNAETIEMTIVEPNIEITHNITETEATPNQEVNISYTVTNTGTSGGHNLELINTFEELTPDSLLYTQNSAALSCTSGVIESTDLRESSSDLKLDIDHLPINESCTIHFKASVRDTVLKGASIENKSSVTKATSMPGTSSLEERDETTDGDIEAQDSFVVIKPDLKLTETVNKNSFNTGELVTYTLKTENTGTTGAITPTITKIVPNNTTFSHTQSTSGWTCTNGGIAGSTCTYIRSQDLDPNEEFEITFAVVIDNNVPAGTTSLTSLSSVTDNQQRGFDETEDNDTTVNIAVLGQPDLKIKVDDGGLKAFTDDKVSYKITYQNIGTKGSTGVVIRTKIPEFSEYFPQTSTSGWTCNDTKYPGECTFQVGSLPVGEEKDITLTLKVTGYAPTDLETLSLTVSIEDDKKNGEDINLTNNTASDITPLLYTSVFDPPSSLKTFNAGGLPEFEWKMVWLNDGNTNALNVLLTDDVPEGTTYVQDSFKCDARGDSTTSRCEFNPSLNRVEWEGMIAPDPGKIGEDDGLHEVVLIFRTTVPEEIMKITNQAKVHWDENGNGTFEDDILYGQIAGLSNNPSTLTDKDPTVWERQPKTTEKLEQAGNGIHLRIIISYIALLAVVMTLMIDRFIPLKVPKR